MKDSLALWLDWEMKDFSEVYRQFNRELTKKAPLWMALSVIGMVGFGFLVGAGAAQVFKIHFPIGCAIAVMIWLLIRIQTKSVPIEKIQDCYRQSMELFFQSKDDKDAFVRQMESHSYGKLNFFNTVSDKCPSRFLAGADYWIYFRGLNCHFIRVADIKKIYGREETSRVHYHMGDTRVRQNLAVGFSLVIEYKENSTSAAKQKEELLYLETPDQYEQIKELIEKYCPQVWLLR